jgi:hypothetical protein
VHLGLALAMQGDVARGRKAIAEGFARDPTARPDFLWDYGSRIRDDALMLALVHERGYATPQFDARAIALGKEIDARRDSGWLWMSTQEQIALARLGKALAADQGKQVGGRWTIGGDTVDVAPARLVGRRFGQAEIVKGVRFDPSGTPPLYASLEVAGIPRSAPAADDSVVKVTRRYYTTDGTPWDGGVLHEGDALVVAVSVEAARDMPNALLTDLLPAGLEIENFNLGDEKQWAGVVIDGIQLDERRDAADVVHEEFRDDRYVAALKLGRGDAAHVFYLVRAVTPGTYTVPPPLVEDMYRPELRGVGRSTPAMLVVKQPGQ